MFTPKTTLSEAIHREIDLDPRSTDAAFCGLGTLASGDGCLDVAFLTAGAPSGPIDCPIRSLADAAGLRKHVIRHETYVRMNGVPS
jgi:hypothetical protein